MIRKFLKADFKSKIQTIFSSFLRLKTTLRNLFPNLKVQKIDIEIFHVQDSGDKLELFTSRKFGSKCFKNWFAKNFCRKKYLAYFELPLLNLFELLFSIIFICV